MTVETSILGQEPSVCFSNNADIEMQNFKAFRYLYYLKSKKYIESPQRAFSKTGKIKNVNFHYIFYFSIFKRQVGK